jgi:hypothetical protein
MTDLIEEGIGLASAADGAGLRLRLLGGVGVVAHCPGVLGGKPHREIADIDVAVPRRDARAISGFLEGRGYTANKRFNALHGDTRMIFYGPAGKLDVFVGAFSMCHALELGKRLELDSPALTATDLLLTKLQIVELNAKDRGDIFALLLAHEVADSDLGPDGADAINAALIASLTSQDWGLQRTFELNFERLQEALGELGIDARDRELIRDRIARLGAEIEATPKSRKWKLRDRIGERKQWYETPEEVDRG